MKNNYDAIALFSGGLDSILAAKLIVEQGLKVKCIHYVSPFFGYPEKVEEWRTIYGLDIEAIDISIDYVAMMQQPKYGFGSTLNPCIDCKILMMTKTKALLDEYKAQFVISGEVLGQRPMSQRRDTLNSIQRDSELKGKLLRPLCAKHMEETEVEKKGIVDRDKLCNFSGRGRQGQLELAKKLNIAEIPTPAGGCKLTEKDISARYWYVLNFHNKEADNLKLANIGRQFWHENTNLWLIIGRNQEDNTLLEENVKENDILLRVNGFPSPLALIRPYNQEITCDVLEEVACFLASYSPKAVAFSKGIEMVEVLAIKNKKEKSIHCIPQRESAYKDCDWAIAQKALKQSKKEN